MLRVPWNSRVKNVPSPWKLARELIADIYCKETAIDDIKQNPAYYSLLNTFYALLIVRTIIST